jgi:fucose 4-O-acetylase-like acetyltransferase
VALTSFAAKDKIPWVYHARGLALLLIVYRHILLGMKYSGIAMNEYLFDFQLFFFNFRMPTFFILSGVFLAKSLSRRTEGEVLKNKVGNLLYPYLLWGSLTLLLQINFSQISNARRDWDDFIKLFTQPRALDQLWYLMALFNGSWLYILLHRVLKAGTGIHIAIALGLHVLSSFVEDYSFFSDFFNFYIFLLTGALLSEWVLDKTKRDQLLNPANLKWILPVFLLGQWFWFTHNEESGFYIPLFLVITYVGCFFLFNIAVLVARSGNSEWLAYMGRYSLYIYILHVQVAAVMRKIVRTMYPEVDTWLLFSICYITAIIFPILFIRLFKNYGVERLFTLQKSKEA